MHNDNKASANDPRRLAEATAAAHSGSGNIAQLYQQIPAIAVVLDERGIILALTHECAVQFSAHANRLVGRSILSLAHRDDRPTVVAALHDAARYRDRITHCEFRIWRGRQPPLSLRASLRAAHRGDGPTVLHAVCSDISDRVSLELSLEKNASELNQLASELLVAQEAERRRIAADMHDTVGHNLALAKFNVDCLADAKLDDMTREAVDCVGRLLQDTIDAVRALTFALDSTPVQDRGLDNAIEDLGQSLAAGSGLQFSLSSRPRQRRLNDAARITLYRAVRELVVNAVKHARAQNIHVSVGDDTSELRIRVADDGIGIDLGDLAVTRGRGLRTLRRNVHRLHGHMQIGNRKGGGTSVLINVPYTSVGSPDEHRHRTS